jgi:hypothetical protein
VVASARALFASWLAVREPEPGRQKQRSSDAMGWATRLPPDEVYELLAPCFDPLDESRVHGVLVAGIDWRKADRRWLPLLEPLAGQTGLGPQASLAVLRLRETL